MRQRGRALAQLRVSPLETGEIIASVHGNCETEGLHLSVIAQIQYIFGVPDTLDALRSIY